MAKRFKFNKNTPKVVISQDKPIPEVTPTPTPTPQAVTPTPPTQKPTGAPLYCIEENVTTGWEIVETNLTKENCKSKYNHIVNTTGLPPYSLRIRRIQ